MAIFDDHIQKVEHNGNFFRSTDSVKFPDWVIAGVFYAALHCVDAVLITSNIDPTSHRARDSYIGNDTKLKPIYVNYRSLEDVSREARYNEKRFLTHHEVQDCLKDLDVIVKHISNLLGVPIKF